MKIDNQTTAVGFAKQTAETMQKMADAIQILSNKIIENHKAIVELERMVGHLKGEQYLTDNKVDKIDQSLNVLDEIQNPTLFDK